MENLEEQFDLRSVLKDVTLTNNTCRFVQKNNTIILSWYEGIPDMFILNLISFTVLLMIYILLRLWGSDYGNLRLIQEETYSELFYKCTRDLEDRELSRNVSMNINFGIRWIHRTIKLDNKKIFERCGPDAANFLTFQKRLLFLMAVITVFACFVIIPINYQGTLEESEDSFAPTNLSNLEPNSNNLWVHVVASLCLVPLTIIMMRKCPSYILGTALISSRTILVTDIKAKHRTIEDISNIFSKRFPDIKVEDIQLTYKIRKLTELEKQRTKAFEARLYCISEENSNIQIQPHGCIICCRCNTKDAFEYYTAEEIRLTDLVIQERDKTLQKPLGMAFITLDSEKAVKDIVKRYIPATLENWVITNVPLPSDLNWENLEIPHENWYLKALFINIGLFLFVFFLTTPALMINLFCEFTKVHVELKKMNKFMSESLPTGVMILIAVSMPVIVDYSDWFACYWVKSTQALATLYKTFFLLVFMIFILPSLGLTSLQAFLLSWSGDITFHRECIFLHDRGAFFIKYIVTYAFLGIAVELLRASELAYYVARILTLKSPAEKGIIKTEILAVFPFYIHYIWTLLVYTITTALSMSCPLITPFGLIYFALKYVIQKYNIYYVYRPILISGEGQNLHRAAVELTYVPVVLQQLILLAFTTLRGGLNKRAIVLIIGVCVTILFLLTTKPHSYGAPKIITYIKHLETRRKYIAPVLLRVQNLETVSTMSQIDLETDMIHAMLKSPARADN